MTSAIITGANGFVGTALVKELAKQGIKVTAVVRSAQSDVTEILGLPGVRVVFCPMEELDKLSERVQEKANVFYHLAWAGSTGPARGNYKLQLTNTEWMLDAVNEAAKLGCEKFIGAGTLAELDVNAYTPLDGSMPNPVSCYGVAKITAHYMSKAECSRLGIDHCWAYLSNTYGIGNYTSNFVNFAAKTMIEGRPANFTSGEQSYDFVHISDTARGLSCIGAAGKKNYAYYIGSGVVTQLKEYIKMIRDAVDPSIQLNLGAIPFNGTVQPESIFDCSKLMNDTGYAPHVSFQDGIAETVPWIRKQIQEGRL